MVCKSSLSQAMTERVERERPCRREPEREVGRERGRQGEQSQRIDTYKKASGARGIR